MEDLYRHHDGRPVQHGHAFRSHHDRNPSKFSKCTRSLSRLKRNVIEAEGTTDERAEEARYVKRHLRVLQLSTYGRLRQRVTPETHVEGVATSGDIASFLQERLRQEQEDVRDMLQDEIQQEREYLRARLRRYVPITHSDESDPHFDALHTLGWE